MATETDSQHQWYVGRDGTQDGPLSDEEMERRALTSGLLPTDLVWREGWAEWRNAGEVFNLPRPPAAPPPLPKADEPQSANIVAGHHSPTQTHSLLSLGSVAAQSRLGLKIPGSLRLALPAAGLLLAIGLAWWMLDTPISSPGSLVTADTSDAPARVSELERLMNSVRTIDPLRHDSAVRSSSFSPDGRYIVTSSHDGTARIWDANTGNKVATLSGHTNLLLDAAFSPDGQRVVTSSYDETARIWDVDSKTELAKLVGHTQRVNSAVFSPDGSRIVTSSMDGTARIWDAANGQELAKLEGHSSSGPGLDDAAFSPDNKRIVTSGGDLTARLWSAETATEIGVLSGHTASVSASSFSPDGERILTASWDGTARIWDVETRNELVLIKTRPFGLIDAALSPDGRIVATASAFDHEAARIWNAKDGTLIAQLGGHSKQVFDVSFSPDGSRVTTASDDNTARIWDVTPEGLERLVVAQNKVREIRSAALSEFDCDAVKVADAFLGDGDNFSKCNFDRLLTKASANEMYVEAVKLEEANDREKARQLYRAIGERFASDPLAVEATKRLAALKDKEDAERLQAEVAAQARAAAEAQRQAEEAERNKPCSHVYVGRIYDIEGTLLFMPHTFTFEVMGFSNDTGQATVRDTYDGKTQEVSCYQIPQ